MSTMLDTTPVLDIALPPGLVPQAPVSGSASVAEFHLLDDGKTGVLALGSFADDDPIELGLALLTGLQNLNKAGATQLIVDVVRTAMNENSFNMLMTTDSQTMGVVSFALHT
jgi:hypothetical protein